MKMLLCLLMFVSCSTAQPGDLNALRFLTGTWSSETNRTVTEEHWSHPGGNTLMGWGRVIANGVTVSHEFTMITAAADGKFIFTAIPSGQRRTEFIGILAADSMIVFENKEHDFPKRVSYHRIGPDSLIGRIEGEKNGKFRAVDFRYKRVPVH
jgi:hypothetical protein